ncbi:MAG: autotransporter outer membrane beta-barrel domain-containing protein, partial [Selenomonas sp.]|nr:autotransporter outer membrane beta-barrel domain-containing protein [Selenomonas sp.]
VYGNNDGNPRIPNENTSNNSITIAEGHSVKQVYGGQSTDGQNADYNTVTVAGEAPDDVYGIAAGGKTNYNGSANHNRVTIKSTGNVGEYVYGGWTERGPAKHNIVEIEGTEISQGLVSHEVYGGHSESGDVEENKVIINGFVNGKVTAGYSATYKAINNTAILNSNGNVANIAGGGSTSGTVELNNTIINGGSTFMTSGGYNANGTVKKNTLTIKGGVIVDGAYGGFIEPTATNKGNAYDNIVNISGGTIYTTVAGGQTRSGDAYNNTVNIHGGTLGDDIWGLAMVAGGIADGGNATGNTVNLYTLTDNINGSIYGGKAGAGKTSADNTVNFLGTAILPNAILEGDSIQNLNVYTKGNYVKSITGNIKNMNFYLPAGTSNGDTMLTVDGGTGTNLDNTTITWTPQAEFNMNVGDKVTLIRDEAGLSTNGTVLPETEKYTVTTGISTDSIYSYNTLREGTQAIVVTLTAEPVVHETTLPERTKSLTETSTAVTALLNGGSDFLTAHGMEEAEAVALDPEISVVYGRLVPFVAIGGGSLELDTGSSTDLKAFYANLGLTKEIKNRNGSLFVGPILEYGRGNYDSYLDNGVHGWGTGHYVGAGGFARQRNHDGLYYEGDLRFGRFSSDYRGDLASGLTADYDLGGSYIAGHLGLGKIYKVNPTDTVDAYIKYFYSRTSGDEVTVHSNLNNEVYNFNSVDSHRLRLGARYYHATNARSKIYAGLAYQYEFNGEAKATHDGLCTPAPSLKGSSYMAEIGWQVKPDKTNMTADVGLTGWTGKQTGITGRLKLSWAF